MKNLPCMILGLIHLIFGCNSTIAPNAQSEIAVYKKLNSSNDSISCSNIVINNFKISDTKQIIKSILGEPDSVQTRIDSVDSPEFLYEVFFYSDSEFYFHKDILFGFLIKTQKLKFNNVEIGNSIEIFEKKYPNSFNNEVNKVNNQMIIDCVDACFYQGEKCLSPDRVIITYDDNKIMKQILAFTY